ncbi:MAG: hypothetical protein NC081_09655 [Roseburia sp.]|nr:hypothetical protein [Roseburia sp.]
MINKKMKLSAAMAAVLLLMAGCASEMPDTTEEQMNVIGEYAAVMLLKYDANNRSRLVDDATIEAYDKKKAQMEAWKQPPTEQEENGQNKENGETAGKGDAPSEAAYDSLEDFFVLPEGVNLVYSGYAVIDSYPDDEDGEEFFSIDATSGKKLLALKFILNNTTGQSQSLDFFGYNAGYRITVNGEETRRSLTTMLINDMSTYTGEVGAQENKELVLLAEMDAEALDQLDSIVLKIKNEEKACTIRLI